MSVKRKVTSMRTYQICDSFLPEVSETLEVATEVDVETSESIVEVGEVNKCTPVPICYSPTILRPKHSKYRDEHDESETEQQYIVFDDVESTSRSDDGGEIVLVDPVEEEMLEIFGDEDKTDDVESCNVDGEIDIKIEEIQFGTVDIGEDAEVSVVKEEPRVSSGELPRRERSPRANRKTGTKKRKPQLSSCQTENRRNLRLGPHDSLATIKGIGSRDKSGTLTVVVRNMDSERPICEPLNVAPAKKTRASVKAEKHEVGKRDENEIGYRYREAKSNPFPRIRIPDSTVLQCLLCNKECANNRALIEHVKSHSADKKSLECPTCKKVFTQQCNLKRHMRCHSGERPFSCSYCKKLFADQGYLTTHLRYHTNTKPYTCEHCKKPFFDRSNYVKHLKSHSGEKPYPCKICKKKFLQQSDLTRHTRVHSGERPFKCNSCERSFTQHGDLTTHLRHHTGERPFVCSHCQKTFANKRYLNGHVKGQVCLKKKGDNVSKRTKIATLDDTPYHTRTREKKL